MHPRLVVEQKITAFANKYLVYAAQPDGSKGHLLAFAQQKRLAFKEKVTFFSDVSKSQVAFTFRAEKVMDIHGRYLVEDADGKLLGSFRKEFGKSLLVSTWHIQHENGQPKITIAENNVALAVIRRYGGLVPILGSISEIVTALLRYNFAFTDTATQKIVGKYEKTTLFRDHYLLSAEDEAFGGTDWRVFAAVTVALDALQSR